jgi:hypothetical protein
LSTNKGWIGVDLDGTLAHYEQWVHEHHIGAPIPTMVERVKRWIVEGHEVRIFTARVAVFGQRELNAIRRTIETWCETHIGHKLPVTNVKDYAMIELWDDRAVQVVANTGERVGSSTRGLD